MNTMTTYSGRKFDPMQMTPGDVYIEDIAHALSLLCRGGGQLSYFYSVGQHSLNCAAEAKARGWSERQQLACLLHDASEGYISDIIRPVRYTCPIIWKLKVRLWERSSRISDWMT